MLAKIICKAVDYGFIIQDDKVVILNIPPTRKALPEGLHIRTRNKRWFGVCFWSQRWHLSCCIILSLNRVALVGKMWCTILNWKMASLIYIFGYFEGDIINSTDCLFIEICLQHSSLSCRRFKFLTDKKSRSWFAGKLA